ncbi:MAG TPA: ferritin-like domain-containing protein [Acidimicrobiia bacterium]|nr:ferritin-like domain-containing protein [Acidimicrobiia bacterium]
MSIDDRELRVLIEESQDLHSDAMTTTRASLDEIEQMVGADGCRHEPEPFDEPARRRLLLGGLPPSGVLAAAGLGAAMVALVSRPAFAAKSIDVQMLQTAAAIETLAVATYGVALTLDFVGGASANAVVKAFVTKTKDQHAEHAQAFNAAVRRLGGKAQDQPDPVLLGVVNQAKPTLTGPAAVVDLAIELETGAAATYVADVGTFSDKKARAVTASIMGVEAQHVAVLNAVKALLAAGVPELIALPPDAGRLPAAAGGVGFPDPFFKTASARPAAEGAVK